MKRYAKYKRRIEAEGFTSEIISSIIAAHKPEATRMKGLYDRYDAEDAALPIRNRPEAKSTAFDTHDRVARLDKLIQNALSNSWDADIVDTKIGYLFGHPISYSMDDTQEADEAEVQALSNNTSDPSQKSVEVTKQLNKYAAQQEQLEKFLLRSNAEDEDSELGKLATICGYAGRLLYLDTNGEDRLKLIEPWECIFIGDNLHEPDYSIYYYEIDGVLYAECYDDTNVYTYKRDGSDFMLDDAIKHMYKYNPLFGVANNRELKGDAERVLALIDSYDRVVSDVASEIEQYRLAYLVAKGMPIDPEDMEKVNQNGIFELLGKDDELSYLTKDVNDEMIENFLNRLEKNIIRFAKSVDFTSDQFGTQITGIAMRIKTMALENKSITMERKFVSALRYEMKVLFSAWATRYGFAEDDYLKVFFDFKRNLPANLLDEAQTTLALMGTVSEETRLAQLSFVDNVQYELEKLAEEKEAQALALPMTQDFGDFGKDDEAEE